MPRAQLNGFDQTAIGISPHDDMPQISEDITQTLGRLLGWDAINQIWRPILVGSDGSLFAAIGLIRSSTMTHSAFTATNVAQVILAANTARESYTIKNNGGVILYIGSTDAVTVGTGFPINPGEAYSDELYTGAVYAIVSAGSTDCRILELS